MKKINLVLLAGSLVAFLMDFDSLAAVMVLSMLMVKLVRGSLPAAQSNGMSMQEKADALVWEGDEESGADVLARRKALRQRKADEFFEFMGARMETGQHRMISSSLDGF